MKKLFTLLAASVTFTYFSYAQTADVAVNTSLSDIGDYNGSADLEFSFDTAMDQSSITEYRAMIVKSGATFNLDSAQAVVLANYTAYTSPLTDNVVDTLMSNATDTDGDVIVVDSTYELYILSIGNAVNDSLSAASSPVTLANPTIYTLPFTEDFESVSLPSLPAEWSTEGADDSDLFMTGNASTANAGNFYPVTDHTNFVFSNDDVCQCDKSNDFLTTPLVSVPAGLSVNLKCAIFQDNTYQGAGFILISNDLGVTWDNVYTHSLTASWVNVNIDISTYAGDTIMVRFHYDDQAQWGSGMAIDDISIAETPDFDISMKDLSANDYYLIPENQAKGGFDFIASIENNGLNTASNVTVSLDINSETISSTPTNVNSGASSNINVASNYVLPGEGNYNFEISVSMDDVDEDLTNNLPSQGTIGISEEIYSRGEGGTGQLGTALASESNNEYGMIYEIFETDTASAIIVDLLDPDENAEVVLKIYEYIDGEGPTIEIASTDPTLLDFLGSGSIEEVRIPLNSFAPLFPGKYLVTILETSGAVPVGMTVNATDTYLNEVAFTKSSASSDAWSANEDFWVGDFYWPIRLELGDNIFSSVKENIDFTSISLMPNPAKDNVTLNAVKAYSTFDVIDLTGKTVMTVVNNNSNNVTLDVSTLEAGVYVVKATGKDVVATERLIIE